MALTPQEIKFLTKEKEQGKTKAQALASLAAFRQSNTSSNGDNEGIFSGTQERLADVGFDTAETIKSNIEGTGEFAGQSPLRRGVQATAAGFSTVPRGALAMAPEPVRKGVESVGSFIGKGFSKLTESIGDTELFKGAAGQEIDGVYQPNDLGVVEDVLGTTSG